MKLTRKQLKVHTKAIKEMEEEDMKYELGDFITSKNGKLRIADDKKHLISLARREIKEWQEAKNMAEEEIASWKKFIKELERRGNSKKETLL